MGFLGKMLGLEAASKAVDTGVNAVMNKHLQEDAQAFNAEQAALQREWSSNEAQLQRDWQTNANQIAMDYNHYEAQLQRAFEQMLSSTAIQRQVKDMKEAGINPILAAQYLGSSTPSGSSASFGSSPGSSAQGQAASSNSNSFRSVQSNILKGAIETIHNARKIENFLDETEHAVNLREKAQKDGKSFDTDEFFEAALRRTFDDL